MPTLYLGNPEPIEIVDGERRPAAVGATVTRISIPSTATHSEAIQDVTHADGHWTRHGNGSPAWVAADADGADLANAVAAYFNVPVVDVDDAVSDFASVLAGEHPARTFGPLADQEN